MAVVVNTAEGGTDGVAVSTGNSGGASGNAFEKLTVAGTGTVTFDDAHVAHGSMAIKTANVAGDEATFGWSSASALGSLGEVWGRAYLYLEDAPTVDQRIIRLGTGSSLVTVFLRTVANGQDVRVLNAASVAVAGSTIDYPLDAWFRLEWHFIPDPTTGFAEVKIFLDSDSDTPDETLTANNINSGTGPATAYWNGTAGSTSGASTIWWDSIEWNDQGYPGPLDLGRGHKRIAGPTQLGTTAATLYTVPSGRRMQIRHIYLNNPTGSPVDVALSIGTMATATRIIDETLAAGTRRDLRNKATYTLAAGEIIQGQASTGSAVVAVIDGYLELAT